MYAALLCFDEQTPNERWNARLSLLGERTCSFASQKQVFNGCNSGHHSVRAYMFAQPIFLELLSLNFLVTKEH